MGQNENTRQRKYIAWAYVFMFLSLLTILPAIISYVLAARVVSIQDTEVWLNAHALWIMRNLVLFIFMLIFSALWYIPLAFFTWDSSLWMTGLTLIGVVFSFVAWLYLLNAFIKGVSKWFSHKAVF